MRFYMRKDDCVKNANDRIYEQLTFAEAKNGVLLGLLTAVILGIANFIDYDKNPLWLFIYFVIAIISMGLGVLLCALSFVPNKKTLDKSPSPNLYFWGDIANFKNVDEYNKALSNVEDDFDHLEAQNIQVPRIIARKYCFFNYALHMFIAGVFPIHWIGIVVLGIRFLLRKKHRRI